MYNPSYENFGAPQGWQCPVCGRVYNPSTSMCLYCSNKETTIQTTGTSADNNEWWRKHTLTAHQKRKFKNENESWRNYLTNEISIWEE